MPYYNVWDETRNRWANTSRMNVGGPDKLDFETARLLAERCEYHNPHKEYHIKEVYPLCPYCKDDTCTPENSGSCVCQARISRAKKYNVWCITANRWAKHSSTMNFPAGMTYDEACKVCDRLTSWLDRFEVRAITAQNPNNKCSGCSIPMPHTTDNECVSCKVLREIGD
jgi:hypothetical protein